MNWATIMPFSLRVPTRGILVLDNRREAVVGWAQLPYRWIKIQSPSDPRRWLRLDGYEAEDDRALFTAAGALARNVRPARPAPRLQFFLPALSCRKPH